MPEQERQRRRTYRHVPEQQQRLSIQVEARVYQTGCGQGYHNGEAPDAACSHRQRAHGEHGQVSAPALYTDGIEHEEDRTREDENLAEPDSAGFYG